MGDAVRRELEAVVGAENVAAGPEAGRGFLRPGCKAPAWLRASPDTTEQVQAIVNLAREMKVGILTCTNRYALPEDLDRKGILIGSLPI